MSYRPNKGRSPPGSAERRVDSTFNHPSAAIRAQIRRISLRRTGEAVHTGDQPARSARDTAEFDSRLVHALQMDGRTSIQELASTLNAPRDFVSLRLRLLRERRGLRVVAALDPGFAGHHLLTHSMVSIDGPARPVAERIAALDETVFVSLVSGTHPLVFESRHSDSEQLHELLERVRAIPTVRQVRVTTYKNVLKGFFVAESRTDIELDELDEDLIALLQHDGRASYRDLAAAVHLSPSATRSRARRLLDAGVIRISAIPAGGLSRNRLAVGVGITLRDAAGPVSEHILAQPAIEFAARTHGLYDLVATIAAPSSEGVLETLEQLRARAEINSLESWTHLDIVKEDYARSLGRVMRPRRAIPD